MVILSGRLNTAISTGKPNRTEPCLRTHFPLAITHPHPTFYLLGKLNTIMDESPRTPLATLYFLCPVTLIDLPPLSIHWLAGCRYLQQHPTGQHGYRHGVCDRCSHDSQRQSDLQTHGLTNHVQSHYQVGWLIGWLVVDYRETISHTSSRDPPPPPPLSPMETLPILQSDPVGVLGHRQSGSHRRRRCGRAVRHCRHRLGVFLLSQVRSLDFVLFLVDHVLLCSSCFMYIYISFCMSSQRRLPQGFKRGA